MVRGESKLKTRDSDEKKTLRVTFTVLKSDTNMIFRRMMEHLFKRYKSCKLKILNTLPS